MRGMRVCVFLYIIFDLTIDSTDCGGYILIPFAFFFVRNYWLTLVYNIQCVCVCGFSILAKKSWSWVLFRFPSSSHLFVFIACHGQMVNWIPFAREYQQFNVWALSILLVINAKRWYARARAQQSRHHPRWRRSLSLPLYLCFAEAFVLINHQFQWNQRQGSIHRQTTAICTHCTVDIGGYSRVQY